MSTDFCPGYLGGHLAFTEMSSGLLRRHTELGTLVLRTPGDIPMFCIRTHQLLFFLLVFAKLFWRFVGTLHSLH